MTRNWTWIDDDAIPEDEEQAEAVSAEADRLIAAWNDLERQIDDQRYRRQHEDWADYVGDLIADAGHDAAAEAETRGEAEGLTGEALAAYVDAARVAAETEREEQIRRQERAPALRQRLVEDQLAAIGCRLARPYEHWHEEERLVEWMETRHDYDDWGGR